MHPITPRLALAVAILAAAGCGASPTSTTPAPEEAVRVAAFDFAESELLAEIYAQALEAHGLPVHRMGRVGSREIVQPAVELGLIDVIPEYAGTMLAFVSLGATPPTADSAQTIGDLRRVLADRGLVALDAAPAQNRNAIVVTTSFAATRSIDEVSDLGSRSGELAFGGPAECPERYFCLVGLREVYGIEFGTFVPIIGSRVVAASLRADEIQVGLLFSTDPVLIDPDLLVLRDDLGLQPAENVIPVVGEAALDRWGALLTDALSDVSSRLDTSTLVGLNAAVEVGDSSLREVAASWLASG